MRPPGIARALLALLGAVGACALPTAAGAARRDPEKLPLTHVRDLHYGDVLFYFYQGEDFEAITRLNAYEQWGRLPHHEAEAELLLAGLYLELGLHNEAGARFEKLLTPDIPLGVRNRAWFYLGKVWYARGYLDRAEQAIRQVSAALPPELEAEKVHLLANILLLQGRFDESVSLLKNWRGPPDWTAYAEFNLGVALVRKGQLADADPFLTKVGTLKTGRRELLALKDRANLALGFAYLQANRPQEARVALERVRLRGPYSNKALLGTGWADTALGNYRDALRPWLELHDRDLLDAAVQESFLAVPYAYAKLNASAQAAAAYESAIQSFDAESGRLDVAIAKLHSGQLLDELLAKEDESGRYGWFWQLRALPDSAQSRYLYTVLAGHDFQEGLKNYRDLAYLDQTLERWSGNMDAYGDMIATREKAHAERIPRTDALLAAGGAEKLQHRREELESHLNAIESQGDVAALGSSEERAQWARILRVEEAIASAGGTVDPETRDKARLIKGVLQWRLNEAWRARLWQERRSFKDLDAALRETHNRWIRVERARRTAPSDTGEFAARLAALKDRLEALQAKLDGARAGQNALLSELAARELEAQKGRLAAYQIEARFALASIYDRASSAPPSGAAPPSPSPPSDSAPPSDSGSASGSTLPPDSAPVSGSAPPSDSGPASGSALPADSTPPPPNDAGAGDTAMTRALAWPEGATGAAVHRAVNAILTGVALAALPLHAAQKDAATIKDLESRPVTVSEGKVEASPRRAMESYRRFLELQTTDPQLRAEALRRLGDLNLESGELERMEKEVTQIDLQGAEAIRLYTTLLKAYPDYPRNDQVLYQLARAYETTGQSAQALATLDEIVRRYSASPQIAEVHFRRGELLFSAGQYHPAEAAYAQVVSHGAKSGFYQQSLYKQGWSLFKQGLNEESLAAFAGVLDAVLIDRSRPGGMRKLDSLSRPDRELVEDTLRVMSITFSYLDGAASLDRFVAGRGTPPYAHLLYARLGDLYVDKQRYQDGAGVYRAFVSEQPNSEYAPGLAMQEIEAYRKGGFADLVLSGKREYVERYNFGAPFWQGRAHGDFPTVVAELKTNLKDVAQYFHASAQKSNKIEEYQQAARWYRDFLQSFPNEPDSSATNYLLAETLFESHQYADAAGEYERTAYGYPVFDKSAAAGYAALVAYQKAEPSLAGDAKADWHRRSIDSSVKFAQTFPQHPDSAGVLVRAAQEIYALGDRPRAISVAQMLLAHQPPADAPKQRIAWSIIGESEYAQGAFDRAEAGFVAARELVPPGDPQRSDLTERIASAVYKQGEAKKNAGDDAGAVEDFLRVARVAPDSKIRATAEYDAATELVNLKDWNRAIEVLEGFRRAYPQSEFAVEVRRKLAVAYTESGRPGQAAPEFERIAADPREEPAVRREAVVRAADLYAAAGEAAKSIAMLERFVSEYPQPLPEAEEARQRLADLAGKAGDASRQSYWLREIVKADAAAGPARTERTHFLAAKATLALAAPARDAFRAIRLTVPLKRSIAAKRKAMESAVFAYKTAADYGVGEVTTAATFEMAELYRTLATDLLHSERPPRLSKEELEQYDLLLEEQAFPFEEQAIAAHEINLTRAKDGTFDQSVKNSLEALKALKPARYGKTELTQQAIPSLEVSEARAPTRAPADEGAKTGEGSDAGVAAPPAAPPAAAGAAVSKVSVPPRPSSASPQLPPVQPLPTRAVADFNRAVTLMLTGKTTDAELELKQLALAWPDLAGPPANLGLLCRQTGRLEDSEQALRTAIEHNPASAMLWTELGLTLRAEGKFHDALAAYERAGDIDPSYAPAHRDAGVLLDLYLGDPVRALREFERYKALTGEEKPVTAWIAEVKLRAAKAEPPSPKPQEKS